METTDQLEQGNGNVAYAIGTVNDTEEIEDITEEEELPIPCEYDISSHGADFPVESLVRRIRNGDIVVPTFGRYSSDDGQIIGFQRNHVWPKPKADRFIESLLLGLPVPGIFLVRDKNGRLLVLDGQQRLKALQSFYDETDTKKKYRLRKVHPNFEGQSYDDLDPAVRRRLDDSIIHATVVKQLKPTDDQSSIYNIFERLNTGGVNLQPQEIRVALYYGDFAHLLVELNKDPNWRSLYGKKSNRLKDLEMILRFFAFYYSGDKYSRPMKDFLNKYMGENRDLGCQDKNELERVFCSTTSFLKDCVGEKAFKPFGPSLNAAVFDSVMTGVAKRIEERGPIKDCDEVKNKLQGLLGNEKYVEAVKTGTSDEGKVRIRQELALDAFANIG